MAAHRDYLISVAEDVEYSADQLNVSPKSSSSLVSERSISPSDSSTRKSFLKSGVSNPTSWRSAISENQNKNTVQNCRPLMSSISRSSRLQISRSPRMTITRTSPHDSSQDKSLKDKSIRKAGIEKPETTMFLNCAEGETHKFPEIDKDRELNLEERASSKDRRISELEDMLALQVSQAQDEDEKWKVKFKQLQMEKELLVKDIGVLNHKLEANEAAQEIWEDELRKSKSENEGMKKELKVLELEKKCQSERLLLFEQDKQHIEEISKNRIEALETELESVNKELKSGMFKLHMEKEINNTLRSELKTNILDLNWSKTQQEIQWGTSQSQEKELSLLKEMNERLRSEVDEFKKNNLKMIQDRQAEKQLEQEKQKKMKGLEQQIEKLQIVIETSEKTHGVLKSRLQTAEESLMKSNLDKEETIVALKLKQSSKELEIDDNINLIIRDQKRKLERLETSNALLEAKITGLHSQISVLESTKLKTFNMQKSTINNLGKMLEESQSKVQELRRSHEKQESLTDKVSADLQRLSEERTTLKFLLEEQNEKMKHKVDLGNDLKSKEGKPPDISSEKTVLEQENIELRAKIDSMEQQLRVIYDQRMQSQIVQEGTDNLLDQNVEWIAAHNQNISRHLDEYTSNFKSTEEPDIFVSTRGKTSSRIFRQGDLDEDDLKTVDLEAPNCESTDNESKRSPLKTEAGEYRKMYECEKKVSLNLRRNLKAFKLMNKNGAKALRIVIKNNGGLEERVKNLSNLCGQMNKIQSKFVQVLEHELQHMIQKLTSGGKVTFCQELETKIVKLRSALETEANLLPQLYKEENSSEHFEFANEIRNCLIHMQTLKNVIAERLGRPVLKISFSANDVQSIKSYEICSSSCKTIKSICCYCQALNNVDNDETNKNVIVTCWQCKALYQVGEKVASPPKSTSSAPVVVFGTKSRVNEQTSSKKSMLYNRTRSVDKGSENSSSSSEKSRLLTFVASDAKSRRKSLSKVMHKKRNSFWSSKCKKKDEDKRSTKQKGLHLIR